MMKNKQSKFNGRSAVTTCVFVLGTAASLAASTRMELAPVGGFLGLILALAWHKLVAQPKETENQLGSSRLELNLSTLSLDPGNLRRNRRLFAGLFLAIWLVAVIPPLDPYGRQAFHWIAARLRSEQVVLRIEYPSYVDTQAQELVLRGQMPGERDVDADAYVSVLFRNRKAKTEWSVSILKSTEGADIKSHSVPSTAHFGHSARAILEQLTLDPKQEHLLTLLIQKNGSEYAKQILKITPQPRPVVELSRAVGGREREGSVALDVRVRSKIPLSNVEFQVRTASGYRMVKMVAEFANANEQSFDGKDIPFSTAGIPFTPKDTLFIKAVGRTVAENLFGESEELKFDIVTPESVRQELIQSLQKALSALQDKSLQTNDLKKILESELANAQALSQQMGSRSLAAKQTERIANTAQDIKSARDSAAQKTEKQIKNLLERLKREQTANQTQNLLARLQNLKLSIQRSPQTQLDQLGKDAKELAGAATALKKQLAGQVEKANSGLTLQERQAALDALKMDRTPDNLNELEDTLTQKKQSDSINKSQSTLEHAQKYLGGVLSLLQQARQRALREAREKLTRADGQLQSARQQSAGAKSQLNSSQQDLDSLPDISNEFQDAARDAQKGNQKAQQGAQADNRQQMEEGIDAAQDGIVRALAALQDEEEAERQSQQEQDGQNFRSTQEALAAQSQLDMGWRRQILDEIARLRASGEPADSPAIQYLESRLR